MWSVVQLRLRALHSGEYRPVDLKVFIKDEPLKTAKLVNHRERIIFVTALEDQVIDHMLFGENAHAEIDLHPFTNSKVGWAPIPAGFKQLLDTFDVDQVHAVDKTAWDWTVPSWVIQAYFEQRFGHYPPSLKQVLWRRFEAVVGPNCTVRMPDGTVLRQKIWGLMKSGWFLTIGLNSAAQVYQHYLALIRSKGKICPLWVMGDDVLTTKQSDSYYFWLRTTGCLVKHVLDSAEFCGLRFFKDGACQPIYPDRHRMSLAYATLTNLNDVCTSLCAWYSLAPDQSILTDQCWARSRFSRVQLYWWALGLMPLSITW